MDLSKMHCGVQVRVPPEKPSALQSLAPRLGPSHSSGASMVALPQGLAGPVLLSPPELVSSMLPVVAEVPEGSVVSGVSVVVMRMSSVVVMRMSAVVGVGSPVVLMPVAAAVGSLDGPWETKPERLEPLVSLPPAQASRRVESRVSRAGRERCDIFAS